MAPGAVRAEPGPVRGAEPDELAVVPGQSLVVLRWFSDGWCAVQNEDDVAGLVPANHTGRGSGERGERGEISGCLRGITDRRFRTWLLAQVRDFPVLKDVRPEICLA